MGILGLLGGIIQVAQEVPLGLGTHLLDELAQHESRDVPHIPGDETSSNPKWVAQPKKELPEPAHLGNLRSPWRECAGDTYYSLGHIVVRPLRKGSAQPKLLTS